MGTFTTVILLAFMEFMTPCRAQTMDQIISAAAQTSMAMDFVQDSDTVLVEYDIKYNRTVWEQIQRENTEANSPDGRQKRKAIRYETQRWTNKKIPYRMENIFSSSDVQQIKAAMSDWERYTCLKFQPAGRGDYNYINIGTGGGCSSYVGMNGGSQHVSLAPGCRVKGVIIHELGHAIGFHHEQTRPDRDGHVRILYQNIYPGVEYNFQKYSTSVINDMGVPYDYTSIMHYGQYAFSRNSQPTIQTVDRSKQNLIGNRQGHSFRDIKLANLMYQCNAHCSQKTCPGEGFVGKDCKCWCPGNPYKECGDTGTGGGGNTCTDDHNNCATWAANGECAKNSAYMNIYCKLSCKKCDDTETGTGSSCTDSNQWCSTWASQNLCNHASYKTYMTGNCKKSCNLCSGGGGGGGSGSCTDSNRLCGSWANSGECQKNPNYMLLYCKKSCGQC